MFESLTANNYMFLPKLSCCE